MQNPNIIGVQFEKVGKIYYFDASSYADVVVGSHVIVNTSRGLQLAKVAQVNVITGNSGEEIKPVERIATPRDLMLRQFVADKEMEVVDLAREHLKTTHNEAVKVATAEYSFDSTRLTIFINSEADSKFNIKNFHYDMSQKFPEVKLEIRQVGPRDIAKALGGMGACGLETRCCSKFLMEFQSISIKMAKTQDISLTPGEITGMCGRLRCCLLYEYAFYEEARKTLPKRKKIIQTPLGEGKVIQVLPLSQMIIVDIPELGPRQFSHEEIKTGKMSIPELEKEKVEKEFEPDVELVPTSRPLPPREPHQPQTKQGQTQPRQVQLQGQPQDKHSKRFKRNHQGRRNRR